MINDLDDILWAWDARHRLKTIVGGDPIFTRASNAWVVPGHEGQIREVQADTPRFPFVTIDGQQLPVLLLEPAAINEALHNEDIDAWSASGAPTVTADDGIAPEGQVIAYKVEDSSGVNLGFVYQDITIAADTASYYVAVSVAKTPAFDSTFILRARMTGGATAVDWSVFLNAATGAVAVSGASLYGAEELDNAWVLWFVITNDGTHTSLQPRMYPAGNETSTPGTSFDVASQGAHHPWGAIVYEQGHPGSYGGETEGSAVTRAAESLHWTGAPAPQAMVIYLDVVLVSPLGLGSTSRFLHIGSSAGTDPRLFIYDAGSDSIGVIYDPGTLAATSIALSSPVPGDRVQVAFSLAADGSGRLFVSQNGGAASSASFAAPAEGMATAWSGSEVWFNSLGSSAINAAKYRRLVMVKPDNLDSALDGTEDDELLEELHAVANRLQPGPSLRAVA